MGSLPSTFSDTIAGYITGFNRQERSFGLKTPGGDEYKLFLTPNTYARVTQNLCEGYQDCTGRMGELLVRDNFVFAYCIFYRTKDDYRIEAKSMIFAGNEVCACRHEEQDWWVKQVQSIADSYLKWQFNYPAQPIDYRNYRTFLHLAGAKKGDYLQETDTISRLVYGFASAYLMTGEDRFLEGAELGTQYLRDHVRFFDTDEGLIYWYHGLQVKGEREQKLLTSEYGDDYDSIPMYEQIYALAGPTQTFRITGDPKILFDIEKTVDLFEKFYKDNVKGGYFSHIDPITLNPRSPTLDKGNNRARKNWNSVGDHAPAYLINLWLATGDEKYANFLEDTFDTIEGHFQDYEHSPFVQERFFEDWSHDKTWGWQEDYAVVGHNLKIAWNIMRMNSLRPKDKYVAFARKIAELMPKAGSDLQRGGWYDVVSRTMAPGEEHYRFRWHDRKAWWQQEQAILAYFILHGVLKDEVYGRRAREAAAFYNAHFLDLDDGGVYFNVLASGLPYLMGNERFKGCHSMSGYHSTELCYLSAVYINLLITKKPMNFYFKPKPAGFKDNILRVSPDILPKGSVRLTAVEIDGKAYANFDAENLFVRLPASQQDLKVKVTISPV